MNAEVERVTQAPPISVPGAGSEVPAVYEAIARVSAELAGIGVGKDRKNMAQGFMFRGIDDIYQVLCTLLPKHGLVIIPRVMYRGVTERQSQKGGALYQVICEVEFDIVSTEDGSRHTARIVGEAMDSGDKATNKAMAIAYKYLAFLMFCIPVVGVIDDPDSETHNPLPEADKRDAPLPPSAAPSPRAKPVKAQAPATPAAPPPAATPVPPAAVPAAAVPPAGTPPEKSVIEQMVDGDGVTLTHAVSTQLDQHRDILSIAPNEGALRKAFAGAYTWASELQDPKVRNYVLAQITLEKDTRKSTLLAESESQ
jgi:hypothetical protein